MRLKNKLCITMSFVLFSLLTSCSINKPSSSDAEFTTENVPVFDSQNKSEKNELNNIANVSQLDFGKAIINIPELSEIRTVEFQRWNWTKTELTNCFIECTNTFADLRELEHINADDISYIYHDEIEDCGHGESVGRNLTSVYTEKNIISSMYNHYSCFYRTELTSADIMSFADGMTYFSDFTDKAVYDEASALINETAADYSSFFRNPDFELYPHSYKIQDKQKGYMYGIKYKGMPMDTNYYGSLDHDIIQTFTTNNFAEITTDSDNNLLHLLSYYNWKTDDKEIYSEWISLEEACEIVDSNLSENVSFNVSRVDFLYKIKEITDDSKDKHVLHWLGTPCWKFTVDKTGVGEFQRLAFFVDAITGEFTTYSIVQ